MARFKNNKKVYKYEKRKLKQNYKKQKHQLKIDYKLSKEAGETARMNKLNYKANKKSLKFSYKNDKQNLKLTYREAKDEYLMQKNIEGDDEKYYKREENKILNEAPKLMVLEEVGNAVTHGVGAIFAIVAMILMLIKSDSANKICASLIYGISLTFMFLMSCLYHSFRWGRTVKRIWRRFDYSSIYLLIGGTFAPLFLVYWGNTLGIVLTCVQWALIILGITFVGVFGPGKFRWLHFTLYFLIGWSGIIFIPGWIKHNLDLLFYILGGGLIYTIGMIPFAKRGRPAAHFIWHIFVTLGAFVQWLGIYLIVF